MNAPNTPLTPQMTSAFDNIWGSKTPPPGGPSQSRANEIRALATAHSTSPDSLATETGKNYLGGMNPLLEDVQGKGNVGAGAEEISAGIATHNLGDVAGGVEKASLGTAADTVKDVFAPISAPIQTLFAHIGAANAERDPSGGIAHVNSPEAQAARAQLAAWAKVHPDLAQTLGDVFTVGTAGLGSGALDTSVADAAAGVKNAVVDTAGSVKRAAIGTITGVSEKQAINSLTKSIQDTMPLQDKGTRIDELRSAMPDSAPGKGGVSRKGILGKSAAEPNEKDIARGTAAHEFIQGTNDPIGKIANVNKGVTDVSDEVNKFLDSKAAPGHFKDMIDYMETNRPTTNLQKDPGAAEAYTRATQDALDTVYKTMKSSAEGTGDFGPDASAANIRQARIAIDKQITKELGENVFGSPQYKGIKAAEIDTRNLLNRMSEDMLRYPGQMEQLNKMNSFISQSRERGIDVDMADPDVRAHLEGTFKLDPTGEADATELSAQHQKMSHLYDARDNLIDKYQSQLGGNKIQEYLKKHPLMAKYIKYFVIGGLGAETAKHLGGL